MLSTAGGMLAPLGLRKYGLTTNRLSDRRIEYRLPEEKEARLIPRSRVNKLSNNATTLSTRRSLECHTKTRKPGALTTIPHILIIVHPINRFVYRIRPLSKYGQPNLATSAGKMLQNAMMPFGVEGGTRSRAAERMITYRTAHMRMHRLTSCEIESVDA